MNDVRGWTRCRAAAGLTVLPLLLGACAFTDPSRVEEDFGNSVRQMVQAQLFDPQAAAEPSESGVDLLDGEAGAASIDGYRNNARAARAKTTAPVAGQVSSAP